MMGQPVSDIYLKELLDQKYIQYNNSGFIESDPIVVPHSFSSKENIEISAFLTATIAWGQRPTIIKNAFRLMQLMDHNPYDYIINSMPHDHKIFEKFCHRTFNSTDIVYFIHSLTHIYKKYGGLESVFTQEYKSKGDISACLQHFRGIFFELPHQYRSEKHVSDISKNAACKRLNLFLRWMVRDDNKGVDFGLWKSISSSSLYIPLDVHIGNVARNLQILQRKQNDWKSVEELTSVLRRLDSADPVKYDFALFGLGIFEKFTAQ